MENNANKVKVHTISLGCPKTRVDTEKLLGAFGQSLEPTDYPDQADLVLVNTCGFIQPAIEESVSVILQIIEDIRDLDEKPKLAVAGCLYSRFGQDLRDELPEVDFWLGTDELHLWPDMIKQIFPELTTHSGRRLSTDPGYAYLKISEGCSHSCAFCTIPSIRGPHTSFTLDQLERECTDLLDKGVSEIIVVGQDVTAFGNDIGLEDGLRSLIERLAPLAGLKWLRLMYLYPAGLTDSFLSFVGEVGMPLLPYFDVPLQHAHPEVLKTMGRPFARDPYKVVEKIRKHIPDASLRTSIITGYPGETEEHFQALATFVRDVRFNHLGVFAYEAEEGTPAAAMSGQVPVELRIERRNAIMEIQTEISEQIMNDMVGDSLSVLIDRVSPEWPGLFEGRTWFQAPEVDGIVYVSAPPDVEITPGQMIKVEIMEAKTYDLVGLV